MSWGELKSELSTLEIQLGELRQQSAKDKADLVESLGSSWRY